MKTVKILLAAADKKSLHNVESVVKQDEHFIIMHTDSAAEAMQYIKSEKIDVVVVAENVVDADGLTLTKDIVTTNPFINCALESPLDHADFHEVTEGYGVFMQLPVTPSIQDARDMIEHLNKIYQISEEDN